jgi:hypothetical protein
MTATVLPAPTAALSPPTLQTPTLQTPGPLRSGALRTLDRPAEWFAQLRAVQLLHDIDPERGTLDLTPPYQRRELWSVHQQRLLMKRFLLGLPIPAVLLNDRAGARFTYPDGRTDRRHAVLSGHPLICASLAWFDGRLEVPATWFCPDHIRNTVHTPDGRYVTHDLLSPTGRRVVSRAMRFSVCVVQLPTPAEEAAMSPLVNPTGTATRGPDRGDGYPTTSG